MTKELHNVIMNRSRYRNKFLKDKSLTSRENYKIHQNLCKKLLTKTKKSHFESLDTKKSRIIRPCGKLLFLFSQAPKGEKIILNEIEKHISDDKRTCTTFNNFSSNVVSNLKVPNYCSYFPPKNTHSLSAIIEMLKKLSDKWHSHQNCQIEFRYFLKFDLQTF